ncbi:YXWGXW repeat-containing protein [Piscinibacter terrae]|nr:YXWGXW repeat-containing protein [Albitalea terrae]
MSIIGLVTTLAITGCATHERVVVREQVVVQPTIMRVPAPIHEERGAPPTVGWNWVPGHWKWEGHDWAWVHGKWVPDLVPPMPAIVVETVSPPPSPAHYWVPGHWVWRHDGAGWVWMPGRWLR